MTYIIAEVGSNWLSFADCKDSIAQAKLCGADAVKFQLYSHHELYGSGDGKTEGATPMMGAMLSDWLPSLAEKAKACGIDFMCTGFSPEGYDLIDPLVTRHKIASSEMCHVRILQKVNSFKKPVYLSTGAQTESDIGQALTYLADCEVTLMYCEASYPAKWVDLDNLFLFKERFGKPVGFSDHTTSIIEIPGKAAFHGSCLEKHFKLREMETPDAPHSLLPDEFSVMVRAIKGKHRKVIGPTPDEGDMITKHKRRLIATKDIKAGEKFIEGTNFGIFRSLIKDTKAMSPFAIDLVNGKSVKVNIKAGVGIGPLDLEGG